MTPADRTKTGDLLLRDHRTDVDPAYRSVIYGAEVESRDVFGRYKARGHGTKGEDDKGGGDSPPSIGDVQGALSVPAQSTAREHRDGRGSWWLSACAAIATTASQPTSEAPAAADPGPGVTRERGDATAQTGERDLRTVKFRPIRDREWATDDRYGETEAGVAHDLPGFPEGTPGIVLAGSEERSQERVFVPILGNRLIAPHRAGDPSLATLVYDLDDQDRADEAHKARISSAWRPVNLQAGKGPWPASGALAWVLGSGGRDGRAGGGLVVDGGSGPSLAAPPRPEPAPPTAPAPSDDPGVGVTRERGAVQSPDQTRERGAPDGPSTTARQAAGLVFAMLSSKAGGPIDVGGEGDSHRIRQTEDGPLNAAHLSTKALWRGAIGDGPMRFEPVSPLPETPAPFTTAVHLRWDGRPPHDWTLGGGSGMWVWQGETFMTVPEDAEREDIIIGRDWPPVEQEPEGGTGGGPGTGTECNPYPRGSDAPIAEGEGPSVDVEVRDGQTRERSRPGTRERAPEDRQEQKGADSGWSELERQLGLPAGSIRHGRVDGVGLTELLELQRQGKVDQAGRVTIVPRVGDTDAWRRTILGGVRSRVPTFATAVRHQGPALFSGFATADGEVDLTAGAASVDEESRRQLARNTVTVGGFAGLAVNRDGTWGGFEPSDAYGVSGRRGVGALLLAAADALQQPTRVREIQDGDHDPASGDRYGELPEFSLVVPGGVSAIDFAIPSLTQGTRARNGVRLRQGLLGLGFRILDGDGDEVSTPKFDFGEGGGIFTGNLSVTGKLTVAGSVDPTDVTWDKQSSNPVGGSDYGVFVSDGTLAGTTDGDLCYSRAGTVTVLGASGGSGAGDLTAIHTETAPTSSGATGPTNLKSDTIAAGTLASDGDWIDVEATGLITYSSSTTQTVDLEVAGSVVEFVVRPTTGNACWRIAARITRRSATSLLVTTQGRVTPTATRVVSTSRESRFGLSPSDIDANSFTIAARGSRTGGTASDSISCDQLAITMTSF